MIQFSAQKNTKVQLSTEAPATVKATVKLDGPALEKRLRQQRSQAYLDAVVKLDALGAVCDHTKVKALVEAIRNEFPELKPHQFLIGIVAKCYLGKPFEVHTLDMRQLIIQHYKVGQPLPSGMEKVRGLAMHPGYAFIEVYNDSICAVGAKGHVAFTRGDGGGYV
ncbi:hypothetical protein [Paenibacillus sp. y28]|uniref:hypothetical protein n=1 Tax=Paenibacillus sp. y28 TaxID=3129110 RepID=UPI00301B0DC1